MAAEQPRGVLITGGSGALGQALVRRFTAAGDRVAFTYLRSVEAGQALAAETGALAVAADLTVAAQVTSAVAVAREQLGHFDVLVNNAGATQVMPFALIEEEDWDQIMAANLKSLFLVTREVVRSMIANRAGAIVNIGSIAGHRLLEVPVHYATAKAGVSGFTIALAAELKRYNIRVNSVVPGLLEDGVGRNVPDRQRQEYLHYCAAGRPGRMDEVADLVLFLAGDQASYINAQSLHIDGGI
jgi:NAD(P)-dependent dehydrogenase (short-subunit alcohol dehydrogenase family)